MIDEFEFEKSYSEMALDHRVFELKMAIQSNQDESSIREAAEWARVAINQARQSEYELLAKRVKVLEKANPGASPKELYLAAARFTKTLRRENESKVHDLLRERADILLSETQKKELTKLDEINKLARETGDFRSAYAMVMGNTSKPVKHEPKQSQPVEPEDTEAKAWAAQARELMASNPGMTYRAAFNAVLEKLEKPE